MLCNDLCNPSQYNDGIPEGSRLATEPSMKGAAKALHQTPEGLEKIKKVRELTKLAKEGAVSLPLSS